MLVLLALGGAKVTCGPLVGQSGTGSSPNLDFLPFEPSMSSEGGLWDIESVGQSPLHATHYKQHEATEPSLGIISLHEVAWQSIGINLYQHRSIAYHNRYLILLEEIFKNNNY